MSFFTVFQAQDYNIIVYEYAASVSSLNSVRVINLDKDSLHSGHVTRGRQEMNISYYRSMTAETDAYR